jgi:hypothetical protein
MIDLRLTSSVDWTATAAMLQAISSVTAILFVILLNRRDKLVVRAESMQALDSIVRVAASSIEEAASALTQGGRALKGFRVSKFADVEKPLSDIPLYQLGSFKSVTTVLELRRLVLAMDALIRDAQADPEPHSSDFAYAVAEVTSAGQRIATDVAASARIASRKARLWMLP